MAATPARSNWAHGADHVDRVSEPGVRIADHRKLGGGGDDGGPVDALGHGEHPGVGVAVARFDAEPRDVHRFVAGLLDDLRAEAVVYAARDQQPVAREQVAQLRGRLRHSALLLLVRVPVTRRHGPIPWQAEEGSVVAASRSQAPQFSPQSCSDTLPPPCSGYFGPARSDGRKRCPGELIRAACLC